MLGIEEHSLAHGRVEHPQKAIGLFLYRVIIYTSSILKKASYSQDPYEKKS
jgi:hypothetical protein